jgi:outer membrane protein insertion porin family
MKKYLISLLLLLSIFNNSYGSEKIVIDGNNRLSDETIIVYGNIDQFSSYDANSMNQILKNLYKTNFFSDVSISFENDKLIIRVIENPIIEDLDIKGVSNKEFKEKLLSALNLKNRSSFNEDLFNSDLLMLENILKTNGYYFSKINPLLSKNDDLNTVRLTYDLDLGEKALIGEIEFLGDKKFKDKRLREAIVSETAQFWKFLSNNKFLDQERINLDKRLLENFYKNRGYYEVNILDSFVEFNDKNYFKLIFNINAGKKYFFDNIELETPIDYDKNDFKELSKIFTKLKGKSYSLDKVEKILKKIDNIALSKKYEFINAEVNEQLVDNKINLTFSFKDSEKVYVERIDIVGNNYTYEEVIRNSLIIDEGDPFNEILFNKSINSLKSKGLFKKVEKKFFNGSSDELKIIEISVEEKPTGEISLGAGTGTSGTSIGGGVRENNFLGKGITLDSYLTLSDTSVKGQFIYTRPNFMYSDNTLFTKLESTSTDNLKNFGYKTSDFGFGFGTKFEQYENFFLSPEVQVSHEKLTTTSKASNNLKKQEGSYTDLYINYNIDYDLRDRKYKPTSGYRNVFAQELPLLSENMELINSFESSKYFSFAPEMSTKLSVFFKTAHGLSDDVRISKRVFVPSTKLRGFEYKKIGPKDGSDYVGGNYLSTVNFTTNIPQLLPTLETLDFNYFIDAANVWGADYDTSMDDRSKIRSSTGLAMDWLTPIGPLTFSFAKPITKHKTDQTETFRFNIGTTF